MERSGLRWTQPHAGSFMSNDLGWAEEIRAEGAAREPFGAVARPVVDEADIAAITGRPAGICAHGAEPHAARLILSDQPGQRPRIT